MVATLGVGLLVRVAVAVAVAVAKSVHFKGFSWGGGHEKRDHEYDVTPSITQIRVHIICTHTRDMCACTGVSSIRLILYGYSQFSISSATSNYSLRYHIHFETDDSRPTNNRILGTELIIILARAYVLRVKTKIFKGRTTRRMVWRRRDGMSCSKISKMLTNSVYTVQLAPHPIRQKSHRSTSRYPSRSCSQPFITSIAYTRQ